MVEIYNIFKAIPSSSHQSDITPIKNEQYSFPGCNAPSRKCTAYSWRIQPIFAQYSLQPIISFERGSNCAEHAINLSNMCLYFYIFTKVQYTIHCRTAESRVVFKMHDLLKKKCSRYSSLSESTFLKFQLRFHAQSQCVTFFQQGSAFQAKYR